MGTMSRIMERLATSDPAAEPLDAAAPSPAAPGDTTADPAATDFAITDVATTDTSTTGASTTEIAATFATTATNSTAAAATPPQPAGAAIDELSADADSVAAELAAALLSGGTTEAVAPLGAIPAENARPEGIATSLPSQFVADPREQQPVAPMAIPTDPASTIDETEPDVSAAIIEEASRPTAETAEATANPAQPAPAVNLEDAAPSAHRDNGALASDAEITATVPGHFETDAALVAPIAPDAAIEENSRDESLDSAPSPDAIVANGAASYESAAAPASAALPAHTSKRRAGFQMRLRFDLDPAKADPAVVAIRERFGPICDQFRSAATRLLSMNPDGRPQALAIMSSQPREGKSTFAANLALLLAEGGHREVVLVDGDLRSGALHRMLNAGNSRGLADVLSGAATLDEALQDAAIENFHLLSAGSLDRRNSSELLSGPALPRLLGELRGRADYIIVDTPTVLSHADGGLIARQCDGALLVIADRRTPEPAVTQTVESLRGNNVRVLGCVLNGCRDRSRIRR